MNGYYRGMSATASWLVAEGARTRAVASLLNGLSRQLIEQGLPLLRASLVIEALHPLISGTHYIWTRETNSTIEEPRFHGFISNVGSRLHPNDVAANDGELRFQLDRQATENDVQWLGELRALGASDVLASLLTFSDSSGHAVTWVTDRSGGFREDEVLELKTIAVLMTSPLEVIVAREMAATLLDTYLGKRSGAQVLSGLVKRGDGESVNAVIWLSDLRGFTALSERLPPDDVLKLLNLHFERVVAPINSPLTKSSLDEVGMV